MGLRTRPDRRDLEDRRFAAPAIWRVGDGVDGPRVMSERQRLVDELLRDEGISLKPYRDSVGIYSIGVGRNLTGKGITSAEAMYLLDNDIEEAVTDLSTFPWFADLDPVRQRVVINMRFQLGYSRFRTFKRMLAALARGDYHAAAESMTNSLWRKQVPTRARRLIAMMETGTV